MSEEHNNADNCDESPLVGVIIGAKRHLVDDSSAEAANGKRNKLNENEEAQVTSGSVEATENGADDPDLPTTSSNSKTEESAKDLNMKVDQTDHAELVNSIPDEAAEVPEIKTEPVDDHDETDEQGASSTSTTVHTKPIKTETAAVKVEQAEATSSTRESCKYGIRCFRRNPMHRQEMAHYGDADYAMPDYPTPPLGTPNCPFGKRCYRRHPTHFEQFSHPPNTDFAQNYKNYKMSLRKRRQQQHNADADFDDSNESDVDPFLDDADDTDYTPGMDDDDDTEVEDIVNSDQLDA